MGFTAKEIPPSQLENWRGGIFSFFCYNECEMKPIFGRIYIMSRPELLVQLNVQNKQESIRVMCGTIIGGGQTALVKIFTVSQLKMVLTEQSRKVIQIITPVPQHLLDLAGLPPEELVAAEQITPAPEVPVVADQTPAPEVPVVADQTPAPEVLVAPEAPVAPAVEPTAEPATEPVKKTAAEIDALDKSGAYAYATEVLGMQVGKNTTEPKIKSRIKAQLGYAIDDVVEAEDTSSAN
jgi:hypothetical protein